MEIKLQINKKGQFVGVSSDESKSDKYVCTEINLINALNKQVYDFSENEEDIIFKQDSENLFSAYYSEGFSQINQDKIYQILTETQFGKDCQ